MMEEADLVQSTSLPHPPPLSSLDKSLTLHSLPCQYHLPSLQTSQFYCARRDATGG